MIFLSLFSHTIELLMKVAILVSPELRFVKTDIRSSSMLKKCEDLYAKQKPVSTHSAIVDKKVNFPNSDSA